MGELVTMPGVNNLNLEIPKRQQFLNADFWHRAVPKIVAVLTIAFLLMIPILGSAFHQLHVLEGWRSTELASTLLNINKTMESMQKRAGPPGTRDTAIDSSWSSWGPWGSCSKTCVGLDLGEGTKSRSRSCNVAKHGGSTATCTTAETETQPCNSQRCDGLIKTWVKVEKKHYLDSVCPNIGNFWGKHPEAATLAGCKDACLKKTGCTAFSYHRAPVDTFNACTLRKCSFPIPLPSQSGIHDSYY